MFHICYEPSWLCVSVQGYQSGVSSSILVDICFKVFFFKENYSSSYECRWTYIIAENIVETMYYVNWCVLNRNRLVQTWRRF